ncbi:UvrD-helicase domain-containing protein [Pseudomonas sp. Marseille-QA0892]
MSSVFERYARHFRDALGRYFPRTRAYLDENGSLRHDKPSAGSDAPKAGRTKPGRTEPGRTEPGRSKPVEGQKRGASNAGSKQSEKAPPAARKSAQRRAGATTPAIYTAARMKIEDPQVAAMRADVAAAVAAGVVGAPSDEQWAMILSRGHATRVFAGAGSGKSATLILRVVFMLCHLKIPAEQLTVISFTNASCAELRERLVKVLAQFGYTLEGDQARAMVRTFHAAMAAQAREVLPPAGWFEQLSSNSDEPDNPLAGGRLKPAQQKLLKQAYQQAYGEDEIFRQHVHTLLGLKAPEPLQGRGKPKAPFDSFKLAGDFFPAPLFELFYQQAGFIESIGLRIDQLVPEELDCSAKDRLFVHALKIFWVHFERCLVAGNIRTFNGGFQQLCDCVTAKDGLPDAALMPFTHLLIDEFQDISPQIVQWVQALHRSLGRRGHAVSLMAIGDDWQSIYGWRGSSPELFIDFDRHFPSRGKAGQSTLLTLETNYRSIDPIIRDAEKVLEDVTCKQGKTCRAHRETAPDDHGVKLTTGFDLTKGLSGLVKTIQEQAAWLASRDGGRRRGSILVLSRRNEPLDGVREALPRDCPVKAMTIHRAKGLQADVVVILDDCLPPERHPLRNALYAYSGFFRNSYDQAMADEALRLGYVAITRGVSRAFWFTRRRQGAAAKL